MTIIINRRRLITGATLGAGGLLAGCDELGQNERFRKVIYSGEKFHEGLQRSLMDRNKLAPEFSAAEMSPYFRENGTRNPNTPSYNAMAAEQFANWKLEIGGLVGKPLSLSLAQIKSMPARTQITRHDCVEGWSAIGKWHGPQLAMLLKLADVKESARFVVFTCADLYRGTPYYESVDMIDAFHPQTILAWAMNGAPVTVGHGAPLRLRVERQLGYKQAKYVMRVDAVASLAGIGGGNGGYWEDRIGYDWYAGI